MSIRPATSVEIPALIELERASPTAAHWSEQQYRELFQTAAERLVLVADESSTGASAQSWPERPTISGFLVARHIAPEWELENIVVPANERRRGLATLLLNALFDHARETNSESVFLEVRDSNRGARALYENAGFRLVTRRNSYYHNPLEDALVYRRELGAPVSD
jgi:ribosomal-protein-alanine N-acetyltransferase